MMEEQHKLEECSYKINANFIMKNRLVEHNNLIVSEELDVITNEDPDAITIILNEYVEYLIDTSVN